jgi:hypothetical protein
MRRGEDNVFMEVSYPLASILAMFGDLSGGYGMLAYIAGRFLYPARPRVRQWIVVAEANRLHLGESLLYRAPSGESIHITCQGSAGKAEEPGGCLRRGQRHGPSAGPWLVALAARPAASGPP